MNSKHLKILKYLPVLSLLGFLGFIKNSDNRFNWSYFIFFGFIFAYWEYKFLSSEPEIEILNKSRCQTKHIIYTLAAILCFIFILIFNFELISYEILVNLATLSVGLLAVISIFINHKLYSKLLKKQ